MATATKEYLAGKALDNVVPKGKKIFKIDEIDKRYEFYYVGFVPPDRLSDEEMKGLRPIFWYDIGLDAVKSYHVKDSKWELADKDTPKFAVSVDSGDFVGQVEEDEKETKKSSKAADVKTLLDDEI